MNKTITYIGRRGNPSLKHYYINDENVTVSYQKVLVPAAKIGALIEITENENGSVKLNPAEAPRIIGYLDDGQQVAQWEALSHSDVINASRRKREKEMNREHSTPVERSVAILRRATAGLNRTERAAFLAYIIQELS